MGSRNSEDSPVQANFDPTWKAARLTGFRKMQPALLKTVIWWECVYLISKDLSQFRSLLDPEQFLFFNELELPASPPVAPDGEARPCIFSRSRHVKCISQLFHVKLECLVRSSVENSRN